MLLHILLTCMLDGQALRMAIKQTGWHADVGQQAWHAAIPQNIARLK
jgi:hypothetical protein